jgi:hypothetical protein
MTCMSGPLEHGGVVQMKHSIDLQWLPFVLSWIWAHGRTHRNAARCSIESESCTLRYSQHVLWPLCLTKIE